MGGVVYVYASREAEAWGRHQAMFVQRQSRTQQCLNNKILFSISYITDNTASLQATALTHAYRGAALGCIVRLSR